MKLRLEDYLAVADSVTSINPKYQEAVTLFARAAQTAAYHRAIGDLLSDFYFATSSSYENQDIRDAHSMLAGMHERAARKAEQSVGQQPVPLGAICESWGTSRIGLIEEEKENMRFQIAEAELAGVESTNQAGEKA